MIYNYYWLGNCPSTGTITINGSSTYYGNNSTEFVSGYQFCNLDCEGDNTQMICESVPENNVSNIIWQSTLIIAVVAICFCCCFCIILKIIRWGLIFYCLKKCSEKNGYQNIDPPVHEEDHLHQPYDKSINY